MDKSLNTDIPVTSTINCNQQSQSRDNQAKSLMNIILLCNKEDKTRQTRQTSFTPTRKNASFKTDLIGTSSQQPILQQSLFQTQDKIKRLKLIDRLVELESRVVKLEKTQAKINRSKRIRRKSNQIAKLHSCPIQNCGKNYGTQTALKKHIQLKHPEQGQIQGLNMSE